MEDSRELFLQTLEKMEKEMGFNEARMASIAGMMRSPRSAFASLLNEEAIVGHHFVLPRDLFLGWLETIIGEQEVERFQSRAAEGFSQRYTED